MEQPLRLFAGNGNADAHTRYRIEDRSYLSILKKEIGRAAEGIGFGTEKIGRIDIVINELASNLIKYGQRKRELLWKTFSWEQEQGIEILAIDGGPGILNPVRALQDGYSTSGTAGEGLGAIQRLADTFDIYSQVGQGTVVLVRLFARDQAKGAGREFVVAGISIAKSGEKLCGDGYYIDYSAAQQRYRILILDGLGHGPEAYAAAQSAIKEYLKIESKEQGEVLRQIHEGIKKTRGAVAMALRFDFKEQAISFCGVGNISGRLVGYENTKALSSFNGIVGHVISARLHEQLMPWERGKLLVVHSDGITTRWDLSKYQHLQKHDPAVIAACLYRDFNRGTDDVTVVVSKYPDADGGKSAKANY